MYKFDIALYTYVMYLVLLINSRNYYELAFRILKSNQRQMIFYGYIDRNSLCAIVYKIRHDKWYEYSIRNQIMFNSQKAYFSTAKCQIFVFVEIGGIHKLSC